MKTSQGKLAALAFVFLLIAVLIAPMRSGRKDDLTLTPQILKMSPGDSYTVKCRLSSEDRSQSVTFSSSDENVAVICADGTVCAMDSGNAVIRAVASGGAEAQMEVQVKGIALSELRLNADEIHLAKGEYTGLRATFNEDATDKRLQWISGDENVARVDASGRITAVGGGETDVFAIAPNGKYAAARVYVDVPASALRITPTAITLGVGASVSLKASYLPEDCTDRVYRWVSSDPQVLRVSDSGEITALACGNAHVSALTKGGLTAGMEVTVEAAPEEIRINPSVATIDRDDTLELQLMLLQSDGSVDSRTTHPVQWTSSNPSIASVDANGAVTGHKTGTCRVTASVDGKTASCQLKVEVNIREIILSETESYFLREDAYTPIDLTWEIVPADADNPTVQFATSNDQVATVDQNGRIQLTGGYGTAVITATAQSGAQADYTIHVVTALPTQVPVEEPAPETAYAPLGDAGADFFDAEPEEDIDAESEEIPAETESPATPEPTETAPAGRSVG